MAEFLLAVGTYTSRHPFGSPPGRAVRNVLNCGKPHSAGIYLARFDAVTGRLLDPRLGIRLTNPSWLAFNRTHSTLYAVSEVNDGMVASFRVTPSGTLSYLSSASSGGSAPCYVAVGAEDNCLYVANYDSGTVSHMPVDQDGSLQPPAFVIQQAGSSVHPKRQATSHPHSVCLSQDGRWALVPDLGADRIFAYPLQPASGRPASRPTHTFTARPGSGPRHMAAHPNGDFVYVVNELISSISVLRMHENSGRLELLHEISTLPQHWRGESTAADVRVHPSGDFLYASNRGHDSIAVFAVASDGRLEPIGIVPSGGRTPRGIALDPSGKFLLAAHQGSDRVVSFAIDTATGMLRETARCQIATAVCVTFLT